MSSRPAPRPRARSPTQRSSSTTGPTTTRGWRNCCPRRASPSRQVIEVARLVDKRAGDNPHVWYDVARDFRAGEGARRHAVASSIPCIGRSTPNGMPHSRASMRPLRRARSPRCARNTRDSAVTATEPVFGYMADAPWAQDAQRPLSARGHERHRAQRRGHRRFREGPANAIGQGPVLQQPDQQRAGRTHARRSRPRPACPSSRDRDRAAGHDATRSG